MASKRFQIIAKYHLKKILKFEIQVHNLIQLQYLVFKKFFRVVFECHNISDAAFKKLSIFFIWSLLVKFLPNSESYLKPKCAVHSFVYKAHGRQKYLSKS